MRYIVLFLCFLITGCANMHTLETNLNDLKGQPFTAMVDRLGYPTSDGVIVNEKYYIWQYDTTIPTFTGSTDFGSGTAGSTPFTYSQNSFGVGASASANCIIRVFVDKEEMITHSDVRGNEMACELYMRHLKLQK